MSDASRYPSGTSTGSTVGDGEKGDDLSGNDLKAAYFGSPVGPGFRAELRRARKLTPAKGLEKAARVAVAASMLLAGRGEGGVS